MLIENFFIETLNFDVNIIELNEELFQLKRAVIFSVENQDFFIFY